MMSVVWSVREDGIDVESKNKTLILKNVICFQKGHKNETFNDGGVQKNILNTKLNTY